ncbi:hypothetical protein EX30DRAFT_366340 [Ascodesmis nigricans]|uniref:Yeast cell wall synthesis Kre9/Knh1-like N-terminal domain-containing protein n=1 Tax=Ascodesmis nigricans TaxID=341454 RepID=A0A4S2MRP7_9PEZI|nr:hypothetical protein EX30DRAFT_366340 [Ascodesmis nigricans]
MRFLNLTVFTTLVALVAAAPKTTEVPAAVPSASGAPALSTGANPITFPLGDEAIKAGESITITWTPTYGSKVDLNLRKGKDPNNLDFESAITSDLTNSGSFTWTVPKGLDGYTFAIEIISGNAANYSPQFEVNATGKKGDATPEPEESPKPSKTTSASVTASAAPSESKKPEESKTSTKTTATKSASTGVPSDAPSAPSPDDDDDESGAAVVRGSVIAVVAGLMAAVALIN